MAVERKGLSSGQLQQKVAGNSANNYIPFSWKLWFINGKLKHFRVHNQSFLKVRF